jgi:predicted transcriptional regulator
VDDVEALIVARGASETGFGRRVRQAHSLSIAETAMAAKVHELTVARYEHQKRRPHGAAGVRYGRVIGRLAELAGLEP